MPKVTIPRLRAMRERGEPIVMLTAYDATFGRLADEAGADMILVGDSLGNVVLGHDTTLKVTLADMVSATDAVSRGVERAMIVADMPFGTYGGAVQPALDAAVALMRAGAHAVKLEGPHLRTVAVLVEAGIPVCGHLGFTPQSVHTIGGHRVQGRDEAGEGKLKDDLRMLGECGAFAAVLELIAASVAARLTADSAVITIGIGAGPGCHGQVQVMHDVLGLGPGFKHAKAYMDGRAFIGAAFAEYVRETREGLFPTEANSA